MEFSLVREIGSNYSPEPNTTLDNKCNDSPCKHSGFKPCPVCKSWHSDHCPKPRTALSDTVAEAIRYLPDMFDRLESMPRSNLLPFNWERAWNLYLKYGAGESVSIVSTEAVQYFTEDNGTRARKLAAKGCDRVLLACRLFDAVAGARRLDGYRGSTEELETETQHRDGSVTVEISPEAEEAAREAVEGNTAIVRELIPLDARKNKTQLLSLEDLTRDGAVRSLQCVFCERYGKATIVGSLYRCYNSSCTRMRALDPDNEGMDVWAIRTAIAEERKGAGRFA